MKVYMIVSRCNGGLTQEGVDFSYTEAERRAIEMAMCAKSHTTFHILTGDTDAVVAQGANDPVNCRYGGNCSGCVWCMP